MKRLEIGNHYLESRGEAYVSARQSNTGNLGYAINAEYFAPFIQRSDHVLDFGSGNGGMLPHLGALCSKVEGLEVNDAARKLSPPDFTIYPNIEAIPSDRKFDVIVSNHVLEHIPDVCSVLSSLRAHLKPTGRLVVKLPIDDIRSKHQRTWAEHDIDHHLHTWTPRLFANVLYDAGYRPQELRIVCSAWSPRLFPLRKLGLDRLAFWAFAKLKNRRQLFAVAVPASTD